MRKLNGKQVRYLRGLGHHLDPVIMVGKNDIEENLLQSVEEVLEAHELIKVKIQKGCLLDRKDVAEEISARTGAATVQILGNTILFYRPGEKKKIELPRSKAGNRSQAG